jgi:hypothetical protein
MTGTREPFDPAAASQVPARRGATAFSLTPRYAVVNRPSWEQILRGAQTLERNFAKEAALSRAIDEGADEVEVLERAHQLNRARNAANAASRSG